MGKRGEDLHERIRWAATQSFLEVGFERTSMDMIAARAETTKRTLYARFENKEKLFLDVVEMVRGIVLERLGHPQDYAPEPSEALVLFCGRYVEILRFEPAVQMCRVSISEAARFPEGAARHFDAVFTQAHARLSVFLQTTYEQLPSVSDEAAWRLLGQVLFPGLLRSFFGVDELTVTYDPQATGPEIDLAPIRKAVADAIEPFQKP